MSGDRRTPFHCGRAFFFLRINREWEKNRLIPLRDQALGKRGETIPRNENDSSETSGTAQE
jgi:hypothetical protein